MGIDSWLFEDFIEFLPIGVLLINDNLQIEMYNKKAIEFIGIKEEDLLVKNLDEISEINGLHAFAMNVLKGNNGSTQQILELNHKFLSCNAQVVKKDGNTEIVILVKDATAVNSLETIRRDYISTILHSLRTPLATLTNSLNILSVTASHLLSGDHAEALSMSVSEVVRLNTLLDDLKELFYIESGLAHTHIRLEQISVRNALDKALKILFQNDDFSIKDLQRFIINGDSEVSITADINKFTRSLYNIIHNALRYSSTNAPIEISVTKDASTITIEIKDQGIGMYNETMPHLFSKFFREDNPINRMHQGQGLGLFFAKSWIELMNGSIMCESIRCKGSVFSITLSDNGR
jgi:two-component system, OmpR family, sensor histidine kinase VicK